MCAKLFTSITVMFLITNMVLAQDLTANISSTNDSDFLVDFTSLDNSVNDLRDASEDVYFDVPEQVSQFDWRTKTFEISSGTTEYTKAEVLNEANNETVKTVVLGKSNSKVDMSDISSGSYYLILTNDSGAVHSEKIVIL